MNYFRFMPKPFSNKAVGFCSFLTQEIPGLILIGGGGGRVSPGEHSWAGGFSPGPSMGNSGERDLALVCGGEPLPESRWSWIGLEKFGGGAASGRRFQAFFLGGGC